MKQVVKLELDYLLHDWVRLLSLFALQIYILNHPLWLYVHYFLGIWDVQVNA